MLHVNYRTTRYTLLLFCTVVKTNIDYQIEAVFVTENRTKQKALFKKHYQYDCTEEFKVVEDIFEGMLNVNSFNVTSLLHLKDRLR